MCGDFNCVLDNELDIISGDQHNARDVNKFNDFVLKSEVNDAWRLFNAEQKEYTWSRKNPFTARRLDYILSTDTIFNNIHDCSVHSVAQSDHRLVNILYYMSHVQRGPSYWKFHESLLHDQTSVEQLNSFFEEFKKDNIDLDEQMKWDLRKI